MSQPPPMEARHSSASMDQRHAVIIGAGPAGLTAALELLRRSDMRVTVLEASDQIGGLSRTVNHGGNRIDIGGHRFFSKSNRVMKWWDEILPTQALVEDPPEHLNLEKTDKVMLIRNRKSRIYFLRRFFNYPISLTPETMAALGLSRTMRITASYLSSLMRPIRPEKNLEDFFINRFGRELYATFFKSYTEKVWGIPCHQISPEWGAQRIKNLSILRAAIHFLRSLLPGGRGIEQKHVETSLIDRFLYPKHGPGQLWEEVARLVRESGGKILHHHLAKAFEIKGDRITAIHTVNRSNGETMRFDGDHFISTMPVRDLIEAMGASVPALVRETADGLTYRDFITVGLLLKQAGMAFKAPSHGRIEDNWIYIQEPDVKVGRLQIFNNWSPYMVRDPETLWLGMEYFVNAGDDLWNMTDEAMADFAVDELERLGFMAREDLLDSIVIRQEKTYPAYFGTYHRFHEISAFVDQFTNLFLIGRNGMHRYNNMDHSMLTAMTAVENILGNVASKDNIWSVNSESEYHEEK